MHPVALELAASRGGTSLQRGGGGWKPARRASPSGRWLVTSSTADVIGLAAFGASGPADPTTAPASVNTLRPRTTLPTGVPEAYGSAIDVERERARGASRAGRAAFGRSAGRAGRAARAPSRSQAIVDERLAAAFGINDGVSESSGGASGRGGASGAEGFFTDDAAARLAGFGAAPDLAIPQAGRGKASVDPLPWIGFAIQDAVLGGEHPELTVEALETTKNFAEYAAAAAAALTSQWGRVKDDPRAARAFREKYERLFADRAYREKLYRWKHRGRKGPKPRRDDADILKFARELLEYLLGLNDKKRGEACPCPCKPSGGGPGKPQERGAKGAFAASVTAESSGGGTEEQAPPPRWEAPPARSTDPFRHKPPIWEPYWPELERWDTPRAPSVPPFARTEGDVPSSDLGTGIYAQDAESSGPFEPPAPPSGEGLSAPQAASVDEEEEDAQEQALEASIDVMLIEFLERLFGIVGRFEVSRELWNYLRTTLRTYLVARAALCAAGGHIAAQLGPGSKLSALQRERGEVEVEGLGLRIRALDLDMLNVLAPALREHVRRYEDDPTAFLPFLAPLVRAVAAHRHGFWDHLRNEAVDLVLDAHALNLRDDQVARKERPSNPGHRISELTGRWLRFMNQSIGVRNGMAGATNPLNYHPALRSPVGRNALPLWERQTEPPNAWIAECERDMEKHGALWMFGKNAARGALYAILSFALPGGPLFRGAGVLRGSLAAGLVAGAADAGIQLLGSEKYSPHDTGEVVAATMLGAALFRWTARGGLAASNSLASTRAGAGGASPGARLRDWWLRGAENDDRWRSLPLLDKLYYEIGQKTLRAGQFGKYAELSAVERGRRLVAEFGWRQAFMPQARGLVLGAGSTFSTGPTASVRWAAQRAASAGGEGSRLYLIWHYTLGSDAEGTK